MSKGRAGRGQPIRGFRCSDELWTAAQDKAAAERRKKGVSEVIVAHLEEYVSTAPCARRPEDLSDRPV